MPRRARRVLVDQEDLDFVGVQVRDEQQVAADEDLLGAAAADDLLRRRVIAEIDDLARHREHRLVALEVDVAEHELVGRGVEDVQLAAQVVERRRARGVGHHRRVAERLAVVADGRRR